MNRVAYTNTSPVIENQWATLEKHWLKALNGSQD